VFDTVSLYYPFSILSLTIVFLLHFFLILILCMLARTCKFLQNLTAITLEIQMAAVLECVLAV